MRQDAFKCEMILLVNCLYSCFSPNDIFVVLFFN